MTTYDPSDRFVSEAALATALGDYATLAAAGVKKQAIQQVLAGAGMDPDTGLVNYHPNPGAEYDTGGMTGSDALVAVTRSTDWRASGSYSWKGTYSASTGALMTTATIPLPAGKTRAYIGAKFKSACAAPTTGRVVLAWRDGSGASVGSSTQGAVAVDPGEEITLATNAAIPDGATGLVAQFRRDSGAAGDIIYVDDIYIVFDVPEPPTTPLDGDQPRSYWQGTPGQSNSVRTPSLTQQDIAAYVDTATKSLSDVISAWGDSITASGQGGPPTWEAALEALAPGLTVNNRGYSGQTSGSIAIRQGGIKLLTTAPATIPAGSTAAVSFAFQADKIPCNVRNMTLAWGTIAGVHGTLTVTEGNSAAGTFTISFVPDAAPAADVVVPVGTAFVPDYAAGDRENTQIFWVGRNDVAFSGSSTQSGMLAALAAMAGYLTPTLKRFLVVSVTTTTTETSGTSGYNRVQTVNAAMQAVYPTQYVDVRRELIDNGLALAGITPTADDLAAIAADTLPPSLLVDGTHPNALACEFVIAPFFHRQLALRGWL